MSFVKYALVKGNYNLSEVWEVEFERTPQSDVALT